MFKGFVTVKGTRDTYGSPHPENPQKINMTINVEAYHLHKFYDKMVDAAVELEQDLSLFLILNGQDLNDVKGGYYVHAGYPHLMRKSSDGCGFLINQASRVTQTIENVRQRNIRDIVRKVKDFKRGKYNGIVSFDEWDNGFDDDFTSQDLEKIFTIMGERTFNKFLQSMKTC